MKFVIIGGSGLIGSKVCKNLQDLGHEVISASPSTGINVITGEGLADALKGADVVVDVANSPHSRITRRCISLRPPGITCSLPRR